MSEICTHCGQLLHLDSAGNWVTEPNGRSDPAVCQSDLPDTHLHEPGVFRQLPE